MLSVNIPGRAVAPSTMTQISGSPIRKAQSPTYSVTADFDNDGYPDIAYSNTSNGDVTILLSRRDLQKNLSFIEAPGSPVAIRVNHAVENKFCLPLRWQCFEFNQNVKGQKVYGLAAGDMDGDGYLAVNPLRTSAVAIDGSFTYSVDGGTATSTPRSM